MTAEDDSTGRVLAIACPVLVTERLVLRKPVADDAADIAALANNPNVAAMLARMPHPYTVADAFAFIDSVSGAKARGCVYAITRASNGAFIGCAGLETNAAGVPEIGYWIGEPHWGKGCATEAAHALVDLGFRATDIDAIEVACRVVNPASRRVIHKCGFQFSGTAMRETLVSGTVAMECYRLDRKTWLSLRSWAAAR